MSHYYYLNEDHTTRPCTQEEYGEQYVLMTKNKLKHVACDTLNDCTISTVWLGINHAYDGEKPHIFETMIFSGVDTKNYQERYSTWEDAKEGHGRAIHWVLDGCKEDE